MAKKRSKRRRKPAGWRDRLGAMLDHLTPPSWDVVRPWARSAIWLLTVAGLAGAWAYGVPRLEANVLESRWAEHTDVVFEDLPAWVNGDLLDMLELTAGGALSGNPFERRDLVMARNALLGTGWFEDIAQVERTAPGLVTIRAAFVVPAAVIGDRDGDHLVDPTGRLLPRSYAAGGAEHQILIRGVHFDRPARPGLQWEGADVGAALRLLRLLEPKPWRDQIEWIDASAYLATETLVIRTDQGARIVWGSAPGEETSLEVAAERKLAYLDKAYEEFARIDTGHTGSLHFYERGYFAE